MMIVPKPQSQWKQFKTKHEIKGALRQRLREEFPTTNFSFSQVILDQVIDETNGTSAQLAIEITGPDLDVLLDLAIQTRTLLQSIPGATDTAIEQPGQQAQLKIEPDRRLCARYNVSIEDVVQVIKGALKNKLSNFSFINCIVPVAMKGVFFDTDSFKLRVSYLDSFFVFRVIDRTADCQSLAGCRVADKAHNRHQVI